MDNYILQTQNLTKKFQTTEVVHSLDIKLRKETVYGFLGPNGAGKSTTIRMLLGLLTPTEGEIEIFGKNLQSNKKTILSEIGSLVENPSLYNHLSGQENLEIYQTLLRVSPKKTKEVLSLVQLTKYKDRKVKHFSLGMRQRLAIAIALLNDPKLIILDEPTNGLDPAGIRKMRKFIGDLPKEKGVTVLLSSHMLHEIEQVAEDVGIINKGKLLFQGSLKALKMKLKGGYIINTNDNKKTATILRESNLLVKLQGNELWVDTNDQEKIAKTIAQLVKAKIEIYEMKNIDNSLEDIFLKVTQNDI